MLPEKPATVAAEGDGSANDVPGRETSDESSRSSRPSSAEADIVQQAPDPPLPQEEAPPLPNEPPPTKTEDDGWEPIWDDRAQAFYFFNRITNISQWHNPRVPEPSQPGPPGVEVGRNATGAIDTPIPVKPSVGGYDPSVHGDYDPNADYAKIHQTSAADDAVLSAPGTDPSQAYAATGAFNRFTGRWQAAEITPENFNDENKSRRQMNAFFDVDAAANVHDGRSLKAERASKKITKKEMQGFKDKRREKKEEKRRAWLRD